MRKITFFFFLLFSTLAFAQFTPNDVKYYVGTGTNTAYLVVDFKDGTDDRSYAWGIRFDASNPINGTDMLELLSQEEPNFTYEQSGGFLDQIAFNSHDSYEMENDYWSLWSSLDGNSWSMSGWMSSDLEDGRWYGASYGFGMAVPGPDAPITPIPAYSSLWLSHSYLTNWIGSGSNESLVIIDFGTDTNETPDSYVFGIKYNGTITAEQALDAIQTTFPSFTYNVQGNTIDGITLANHNISNSSSNLYTGTDLSNWTTVDDFTTINLNANEWLGISFGTRRPFIPQDGNAVLSTNKIHNLKYTVYPNPSSDYISVQLDEEIQNVSIYTLSGSKVLNSTTKLIDISQLSNGVYMLEVTTHSGKGIQKIIKN